MLTKIIDGLSSKLADQWIIALFTPAFLFWAGGFLGWVWHFGWTPFATWFVASPTIVQLIVLIGALLTVIISGLIVQRFDLLVLRLLEGYWPPLFWKFRDRLIERVTNNYQQKYEQLQALAQKGLKNLSSNERMIYVELDQYLMRMPAESAYFMPTTLGNILRAAEYRPKAKYGLDAVICWSRLWLLLPDGAKQELSDARTTLNAAARLLVWSVLFLIWVIFWIIWLGWWAILVFVLAILSGGYAYFWMIRAAETYGDLLDASFDLYRSSLYRSLRWPLPGNPLEEHQMGAQLTNYLWRGSDSSKPSFIDH